MDGITLMRPNDTRTAMAVWYHEDRKKWFAQTIDSEDNRSLGEPSKFDSREDAVHHAASLGYSLEGSFREVEVHQKRLFYSVYAAQPANFADPVERCPLIAYRLPSAGFEYELLVALERLATFERPVASGTRQQVEEIRIAFQAAVIFRDQARRRSGDSRYLVIVLETVIGPHIVSREAN